MKKGTLGLVAALLAGGCGLIEDPTPETARVIITGDAGKRVRLIVATRFVAAVNEIGQTRVIILKADTLVTTLPYERLYEIKDDQQFFAETARLETDLQAVRMEVYVDQRKQFDKGGSLLLGQPYRFVYTFNQTVTREILVI